VPLWPVAGRALNIKRGAAYAAAEAGEIPTLDVSRKKTVATSWLRKKLGLGKKRSQERETAPNGRRSHFAFRRLPDGEKRHDAYQHCRHRARHVL
jgi:hypothetical protein